MKNRGKIHSPETSPKKQGQSGTIKSYHGDVFGFETNITTGRKRNKYKIDRFDKKDHLVTYTRAWGRQGVQKAKKDMQSHIGGWRRYKLYNETKGRNVK